VSLTDILLAFLSAVGAGIVNAIAGGGTLITFPTLIALGLPAVSSNITSTVALCPGYLGATFAQRKDLVGQKKRTLYLLPAGAAGGIMGGFLLLNTSEKLFVQLVPYLILTASLLLALQEPVRRLIIKKTNNKKSKGILSLSIVFVFLSAIYGGYFGAGLSVIVLTALGITINDSLTRLNALKQFISFSVNISAAVFFLFSSSVILTAAIIMIFGSLLGGFIGGKIAAYIKPQILRIIVVIAGIIIALIYFIK